MYLDFGDDYYLVRGQKCPPTTVTSCVIKYLPKGRTCAGSLWKNNGQIAASFPRPSQGCLVLPTRAGSALKWLHPRVPGVRPKRLGEREVAGEVVRYRGLPAAPLTQGQAPSGRISSRRPHDLPVGPAPPLSVSGAPQARRAESLSGTVSALRTGLLVPGVVEAAPGRPRARGWPWMFLRQAAGGERKGR